MIARKCDICGKFFTPYLESNTISGKRDSQGNGKRFYRKEHKNQT